MDIDRCGEGQHPPAKAPMRVRVFRRRANRSGARHVPAASVALTWCLLCLTLVVASPAGASAIGTLDQQSALGSGSNGFSGSAVPANPSVPRQIAGQLFTPSVTGPLVQVSLHAGVVTGGGPFGHPVVEIHNVDPSTGFPTDVLATAAMPDTAVTGPFGEVHWTDVVFDNPAMLTAEQMYAIEFSCTDCYQLSWSSDFSGPYTPSYPRGHAIFHAGNPQDPEWQVYNPADLAPGLSFTFQTYMGRVDTVPPVVAGSPDRPANAASWYNAPVTVSWTSTDPAPSSGAPTQPAPTVAATEGNRVSYTSAPSCDPAGNCATGSIPISIDMTAPTIAFSGNSGTYPVDTTVAIACAATDALSGIASNTCSPTSQPAYSFGVGSHTITADATDNAGNHATASTSFTVTVTAAGLCSITRSFIEGSPRFLALPSAQRASLRATGTALCALLATIPPLSPKLKAVAIALYQQGTKALIPGGWLTSSQATTLSGLAAQL